MISPANDEILFNYDQKEFFSFFMVLSLIPRNPRSRDFSIQNRGRNFTKIQFSSKLKTNLMKTQRGALLNTKIMRSKTKK
jgi:hypothetical protein